MFLKLSGMVGTVGFGFNNHATFTFVSEYGGFPDTYKLDAIVSMEMMSFW
jgi:hypothetical protein